MRSRRILSAALVAWVAGGCGILDEGDPEEITVQLTSDETQEVLLVTSTDFVLVEPEPDSANGGEVDPPPRVELIRAHYQGVESPWAQGFDIREAGRFYVRVQAPVSLDSPVTLTVRSDGSLLSSKVLSVTGSAVEVAYILER